MNRDKFGTHICNPYLENLPTSDSKKNSGISIHLFFKMKLCNHCIPILYCNVRSVNMRFTRLTYFSESVDSESASIHYNTLKVR